MLFTTMRTPPTLSFSNSCKSTWHATMTTRTPTSQRPPQQLRRTWKLRRRPASDARPSENSGAERGGSGRSARPPRRRHRWRIRSATCLPRTTRLWAASQSPTRVETRATRCGKRNESRGKSGSALTNTSIHGCSSCRSCDPRAGACRGLKICGHRLGHTAVGCRQKRQCWPLQRQRPILQALARARVAKPARNDACRGPTST
mmetsp:Transcript_24082/g.62840  ORF Transcript_24082/g.62840 Transcript_24082/m.62840 type:complete len:203 (+) Transcript_24082:158-766(+)